MTERGLPIVGGAPACPFVAFDDDRDERATSPDHRHRCYAEAQPAPRALAHQEAYCLSSAFPVCPTFQDWARREAARARPPDVPPADADEDDDLPPLVTDVPPRRASRGTWSAPPPWLRGTTASPGAGAAGPPPAARRPGDDADEPGAPGAAGAAAAGGLSGSFADRLASEHQAPAAAPWDVEPAMALEEADDEDQALAAAPPPRRRERLDAGEERGPGGRERNAREARDPRDVAAPSWERPRRLEAYPTLRSRRLSEALVSPILLGIVALILAALALFFLPSLLGSILGPGGGSPAPSTAGSVSPSQASFEPTIEPVATPFLYTVQTGDTLTKIAKKFGISLAALIDANKASHPNPDVLNVGDQLIIPTALPSELPGASAASSP